MFKNSKIVFHIYEKNLKCPKEMVIDGCFIWSFKEL